MTSDDTERSCSASFCEKTAVELGLQVVNESDPDDMKAVDLCDEHYDKLRRYNEGEEVDWNV